MDDPSFEAFRKEVAAVAQRKDRPALAKMVVAKGFFWERDDGKAAPKKSGIDILAQALNLPAKDGSGWEALAGFASEATAAPLPERKEVLCAPADPTFDDGDRPFRIGSPQTVTPQSGGGEQTGSIALPAGPPPSIPDRPYILIVPDPDNLVGEPPVQFQFFLL